MKKILSILSVAVLAASCQFVSVSGAARDAQTVKFNGPVVTDTLNLKDFQTILVNGQGDVTFVQDDEFLVVLTANEGVAEKLDCRVEKGTLILEPEKEYRIRAKKYAFEVHAPYLTRLTVNGAADLKLGPYADEEDLRLEVNGAGDVSCQQVNVPKLKIVVNGAGDIDALDIQVDELVVEVNGAGDAKLTGEARKAILHLSGAGDIDASRLKTDQVEKRKNGVGSIRL